MYIFGSDPTVTNCTFHGNDAPSGGGAVEVSGGTVTLENCIAWGNTGVAEIMEVGGGTAGVTYSDVAGGWPSHCWTRPNDRNNQTSRGLQPARTSSSVPTGITGEPRGLKPVARLGNRAL